MFVGVAGLGLSAAALPISSTRLTPNRLLLALMLLTVHVAASIAYYLYSLHNVADAHGYYFDPLHLASGAFGLGSMLTLQLTQFLRYSLGASYFECFLLFQAIGFGGVMLLMRTFQEIEIKMKAAEATLPKLILFIPSIHFWTGAIGKDAPVFFGICLCIWAMIEMRRRKAALTLGILVILLFRPHIALILVVCIGAAGIAHQQMSLGRKLALTGAAIAGILVLAIAVQKALHVDVTSPSSIVQFFSDRNDVASKVGGATTFGNASMMVRFISLLFRPFFFDTGGLPGVIASIENIGSGLLFAYLVKNWGSIRFLTKRVMFLAFCVFFSGAMILMLGLVNYNIGTGIRQRIMVLPALLCVFVASWVRPRVNASIMRRSGRDFVPYIRKVNPPAGAAGS